MNELAQAIEPAIAKLSEIFCVSVDVIRENGMEYIMMYGRYYWITDVASTMVVALIISMIVAALVWALWVSQLGTGDMIGENYNDRYLALKKVRKNWVIATIIFISIVPILAFISTSLAYWLTPEMYSINAVMQLIN